MVDETINVKPLWTPNEDKDCAMNKFIDLIKKEYKIEINCYDDIYHWSIENYQDFWKQFYKFSGIIASTPYDKVVGEFSKMSEIPKWFVGAKLNFAENILRNKGDNIAIISVDENLSYEYTTFNKLGENVINLAKLFKASGIVKGDVIGSILPNTSFSVEAMLATASLGAIWTCASPETQTMGILMRINQTNPKIMLSNESVIYSNKRFSQMEKLETISHEIKSLEAIIIVPDKNTVESQISKISKGISLEAFQEKYKDKVVEFEFEQVSFDHPLFVMYSSGTTGIPKGLVHSVGGTLIQQLKDHILHNNITKMDTFFYYTITAWMMWNWSICALYTGCKLVLFDGCPYYPNEEILWKIIEKEKITVFGAGAAYYQMLENRNFTTKDKYDVSALKTVLSTGSVLPGHTYDFIIKSIKERLQIGSIAAGTDIISCFGGVNPILPVYNGEVQCRNLAMSIYSWSETEEAVYDVSGELVVTKPFPSMPVYLWNDKQKTKYLDTYFSKFPTVWAQGDFCIINKKTKGIIMLGRSDATLNPRGVRYGSAEIYNIVEKLHQVEDSLCVGQIYKEDERVILFIKLSQGFEFNDQLIKLIKEEIRNNLSPRHVPDIILHIKDVPYTLTGKKIEMAVKRIISKQKYVIQKESLRNPEALEQFHDMVRNNQL